jgi:hypothetical protein
VRGEGGEEDEDGHTQGEGEPAGEGSIWAADCGSLKREWHECWMEIRHKLMSDIPCRIAGDERSSAHRAHTSSKSGADRVQTALHF